jgi:iron complex outermembrane recepter protein
MKASGHQNSGVQIDGAFLDADARALFGQIDYNFSPTCKTTVGPRYTEDGKDAEEYRTRVLYGFPNVPYAFHAAGEIDRRSDGARGRRISSGLFFCRNRSL